MKYLKAILLVLFGMVAGVVMLLSSCYNSLEKWGRFGQ